MQNVSTIVSELYRNYAKKLYQAGYHLDLDVLDPTFKPAHPAAIKKACTLYFDFLIKTQNLKSGNGNITLGIKNAKFYLKDDVNLLSSEEKAPLNALATTTHSQINVRSRLGFGTVITID